MIFMGNKMKVLHIIFTLNLGGAETNLFNLVTAFSNSSSEHHVAYSSGGEIEARFIASGIPLFKITESAHKIKSPVSFIIIARLLKYIKQNKIDIIHSHSFNGHVWGGLAARLAGKKVVEHVHDGRYHDQVDYAKRFGGFTQFRYVKYFCWLSDAVVVLTDQNKQYIINNCLHHKDKIWHIMNGIAPKKNLLSAESKYTIKQNLQLSSNAFVITSLSRMSPEKNIELILRIAPIVKQHIPDAVFIVAGNGPLLDKYRKIVKESDTDYVRIMGYCDKTTDLLSVSDVFLLPSFLELHSIALLEAMRMGLPVLTSKDVGSSGDFIAHKNNGFLLDPFEDDGWEKTIIDLWESPHLRQQVGQAAIKTCEHDFDIASTAAKFEQLYEHILNS
jgi:glycosyltransferase involved in cell wall biosynthesis